MQWFEKSLFFAHSERLRGRPYVNQVYDFALDTKVKDQAHKQ